MNSKHLNVMTRSAALSAYLQTEKDVEESHVIASKLKGEQLRHHLEKNTKAIVSNLKQQYKAGTKKEKKKLLEKLKKFIEDHKDRWPAHLEFIETRLKTRAS